MTKLHRIFPDLSKARVLLNQHAYEQAIEMYSKILYDMDNEYSTGGSSNDNNAEDGNKNDSKSDNKEKCEICHDDINTDDHNDSNECSGCNGHSDSNGCNVSKKKCEICHNDNNDNNDNNECNGDDHKSLTDNHTRHKAYIYIEYAHCLIKNTSNFFKRALTYLSTSQSILHHKPQYEDDLETAWNVLEQSRLYFLPLNDHAQLRKVYFLQGEIYLLNDQYSNAVVEYNGSLRMAGTFVTDGTLYKRLAECHYFMGDTEQALVYYDRAYAYYTTEGNDRQCSDISFLRATVTSRDEVAQGVPVPASDDRTAVDVSHLLRKKK